MTDDKGESIGKDMICTYSIPQIESRIRSLEQIGRDAVAPEGMHPVDLYFTDQANRKIRFTSCINADQLRTVAIRRRVRSVELPATTWNERRPRAPNGHSGAVGRRA